MFNKLLVALNTSEPCTDLFDQALALAQSTGAELTLLSVLAPDYGYRAALPYYPLITSFPTVDESGLKAYQQKFEAYEEQGQAKLSSWCERATVAGVRAEFAQVMGAPGKMICDRAKTDSIDLIIVGSRGLKGLRKLFIGSVSNYVMHHAPCSVMVVHQDTELLPEAEKASSQASAA